MTNLIWKNWSWNEKKVNYEIWGKRSGKSFWATIIPSGKSFQFHGRIFTPDSTLNDQLEISVRTTKINGLPHFLWYTLVWAKPGVVCLQICLCQLFGSCLNVPNCSPEMFLLNSIKKTSKDFTCQIFEDIVQNRTCEDYYHWLTLR